LNASTKEIPHMLRRSHDASLLIGNIVLQTGSRINGKLNPLIDRPTQSAVVLGSIEIVCIVFRIVDVIFWTIAAKTFGGNFEFLRAKSKSHESEDPEKNPNRFCGNVFDRTDIDCLCWEEKILAIVPICNG
jgi:hypothetical protein